MTKLELEKAYRELKKKHENAKQKLDVAEYKIKQYEDRLERQYAAHIQDNIKMRQYESIITGSHNILKDILNIEVNKVDKTGLYKKIL